jgi:hypothetical protein
MAHDIFISYASEDKAIADAVCATLEKRGIRCWYTPRDVAGNWSQAIADAIITSRALVLVLSSHSDSSRVVKDEVQTALNKELPVIPLRVEDGVPTGAMAFMLANIHWLDALTPSLKDHLTELADKVESILNIPKKQLKQKSRGVSHRTIIIGSIIIACLAIVGMLYMTKLGQSLQKLHIKQSASATDNDAFHIGIALGVLDQVRGNSYAENNVASFLDLLRGVNTIQQLLTQLGYKDTVLFAKSYADWALKITRRAPQLQQSNSQINSYRLGMNFILPTYGLKSFFVYNLGISVGSTLVNSMILDMMDFYNVDSANPLGGPMRNAIFNQDSVLQNTVNLCIRRGAIPSNLAARYKLKEVRNMNSLKIRTQYRYSLEQIALYFKLNLRSEGTWPNIIVLARWSRGRK